MTWREAQHSTIVLQLILLSCFRGFSFGVMYLYKVYHCECSCGRFRATHLETPAAGVLREPTPQPANFRHGRDEYVVPEMADGPHRC